MTCTERKRLRTPHQPVGRWIRVEKRLAIYLRDDFTCLICDSDLSDVPANERTLDHIKPRSKGGSNHESNLFTCCVHCNATRQTKPLSRMLRGGATYIREHASQPLDPFKRKAVKMLAAK